MVFLIVVVVWFFWSVGFVSLFVYFDFVFLECGEKEERMIRKQF